MNIQTQSMFSCFNTMMTKQHNPQVNSYPGNPSTMSYDTVRVGEELYADRCQQQQAATDFQTVTRLFVGFA